MGASGVEYPTGTRKMQEYACTKCHQGFPYDQMEYDTNSKRVCKECNKLTK